MPYLLIGVEVGRLLGDQRYRGTKTKSVTSCDNAFVTNIVLLLLLSLRFRTNKTLCCRYVALTLSRKRHLLVRDPAAQRMFSVRKRAAATNAQSERKSTLRFNEDLSCVYFGWKM